MTIIDISAVADAITAHLDDLDTPGRFATAPAGNPTLYWVLELPPGTTRTGTMGLPEQGLAFRFRIRSVARSEDKTIAARAAVKLGGQCAARFLDRTVAISGDGWEVTNRTQLADGGTDGEGQIVNHTADFEATVSAASLAP